MTTPVRSALLNATRSSVMRGRRPTMVHFSLSSALWIGNGATNTAGISSCVADRFPDRVPPRSLAVRLRGDVRDAGQVAR